MKEVTFNVILNEPDQLVHLDLYKPKQGFMIFAHFVGENVQSKLIIKSIEFYVKEIDITIRSKSDNEMELIPEPIPKYHEIDILSYNYITNYKNEDGEVIKQISFNFNNKSTKTPNRVLFDTKYLPIKLSKGEKIDFKITPIGFPKDKDNRESMDNINSHICNIKIYSK